MKKQYDFLIVGAGLFGATFARVATDRGYRCLVVERRDVPGGNVRCESVAGINVHRYGAHIFHTSDERVWQFVNRYARFNRYTNSPVAQSGGRLYNLPFNMNTFYQLWGCKTPAEAVEKLQSERHEAVERLKAEGVTEPRNLEEQALTLVGRDIYEKLIRDYTEKQWGRRCRDLPAFIIRRLPLRLTFDNNYFNDLWQGIPEGGYNPLIDRLLDGVEVICGCDFFDDRERLSAMADAVVFSGKIDQFYDYRFGRLQYRSVRFETEVLDTPNYQGVAVVNYTDSSVKWTRIIEHKHFEFQTGEGTVITREYPATWKKGDEPYYPINDEKNGALYAQYAELAKKEANVLFGGRMGQYKYYDMDKVIAEALKCVKEEIK